MILHLDMDAFYASVEEREDPTLRGRPVVVGGTPEGRGVVAAANYVARTYGIHSAMSAAQAKRLCPQAIFLPARHDEYARVSRQIRAVFERYTPVIEPLSLDEAFLDVSASTALFGPAQDIARRIKAEVKSELGLTVSVGVAANKFIAKIASDLDKPDGYVAVPPGEEAAFLAPLPISRLWGVGKVGQQRLHRLGIRTIGDLRRLPQQTLQQLFGKWGEQLARLAAGIDHRAVVPDYQAKSISHETTFERDLDDLHLLRAWLMELTGQVASRLRRNGLKGRVVNLKLRTADFTTRTRRCSLDRATDSTKTIWRTASALLQDAFDGKPVRLVGVGVSGLDEAVVEQGDLFGDPATQRDSQLDRVADSIAERYGKGAVRRATDLKVTR